MYHLIVQESVVRRQRFHLASPSLHHLWMAMTHCIMGGRIEYTTSLSAGRMASEIAKQMLMKSQLETGRQR